MLAVTALDVTFDTYRGPVQVLKQVSFQIARGEILGVVGESGAGKSMTGLAIIGLIDPPGRISGGTIALNGRRIDDLQGEAIRVIRGRRIAMVFQDPLTSLNPVYTIGHHLIETIRTHLPLSEAHAKERALELLEEVEVPLARWRFDQFPHQLSGGLRQRVAIALALCAEPELLIADEPTTALDVSVQAQIIRLLRRLCQQRQLSAMLITHDMGVIAEAADRVMVMNQGRVVETGLMRQLLEHPVDPYTRALMAAIPSVTHRQHRLAMPDASASVGGTDTAFDASVSGTTTEADLPLLLHGGIGSGQVAATVRIAPEAQVMPENSEMRLPLLQVSGLSRQFDLSSPWLVRLLSRQKRRVLRAVDDVGFQIPRGHTFGLVGESGSGKTTVARMLAGLLRPTSGRVVFDGLPRWGEGADSVSAADRKALLSRCQMIFQDPYASLNPRWRVDDLIAEPLRVLGLARDRHEIETRVVDMLGRVRMSPDDGRKYPHQFSGGQRQRIAIARALISKPEFIICDEPTSALDVSVQAQVLNLMRDLQDEFGLTYLLISHNLAVIRFMCDDVGVMQRGLMVEQGTAERVLDDPQDEYTRHLLASVPTLEGRRL
ncbi:MAG: ABC transporter ATP-binding protein [Lautropia sp.]|nr:ABC transporter ATP-binding protein [Lautropia sp.]